LTLSPGYAKLEVEIRRGVDNSREDKLNLINKTKNMTNAEKIKVAHWAGLALSGWEDNAPQFIGTEEQWELYTETLDELEGEE
jgi:hypothetical protein